MAKHLFYIHSHITYLVSIQVIKYLGLEYQDCVLLLGRNYKTVFLPPVGVSEVEVPFTHLPVNSFGVKYRFWEGWKKLYAFDVFADKVTKGDTFHLYTNQTGIDFIRLFISHKKCGGFSYLEEGLASYYKREVVNEQLYPAGPATHFFKLLLLLNFKGRLSLPKEFYQAGYSAAYGVQPAAFPGFPNRVILGNPFSNSTYSCAIEGNILVLDAFYEYGHISEEVYEHALAKAFKYLQNQEVKTLWVKFHPQHYATPPDLEKVTSLLDKYKGSIRLRELPAACCLELLAGSTKVKNLSFYIFLSSVGMYAALCERTVYSFAPFIAEKDGKFRKRIEELPVAFRKHIIFLD